MSSKPERNMTYEFASPTRASASSIDDAMITERLVHSTLASAKAIHGALARAIADEAAVRPDSLLGLAMNRLDSLSRKLVELEAHSNGSTLATGEPAGHHGDPKVEDGSPIELYSAFEGSWSPGFEIASAAEIGYRVRRRSDGSLLPGYTSRSDLRPVEKDRRP